MRIISRSFAALAAFAAVYIFAGSGEALAFQQLVSPFGPTAPVRAAIGSNQQRTAQAIVWVRLSDGACASTQIGDSAGLWDDYQVIGSSGNDILQLMLPAVPTFCGFQLDLLVYNGHFIDLYGGDGNDYLDSYTGDTWLFGQGGNDLLSSYASYAVELLGGPGNDSLVSWNGGNSAESLFGEEGDDCLEDTNAAAAVFNCGVGWDYYAISRRPPVSTACETLAPYPHVCPRGPIQGSGQ